MHRLDNAPTYSDRPFLSLVIVIPITRRICNRLFFHAKFSASFDAASEQTLGISRWNFSRDSFLPVDSALSNGISARTKIGKILLVRSSQPVSIFLARQRAKVNIVDDDSTNRR